jgi:hypothetical protein
MSLEFLLSDIVNLIWILISIFGVSMAFRTSVEDDPTRRRRWFRLLASLALIGLLASHLDKALNARTQAALQGKLDTSIGNESRMEGKLGFIGDTVSKFNCPGAQEFAAAIKQAIPPSKNPPAGIPTTATQTVMPPAFQYRLSSIDKQLHDTLNEYFEKDRALTTGGSFMRSEEVKEREKQANREALKPITAKFNSDYKQLFQIADQLRGEMVGSLAPGSETAEDREQAVVFLKATQGDFNGLTPADKCLEYLYKLYDRLPPDKKS